MKSLFSIPAICAVLAMGQAYAQTHTTLRAEIPFSFQVGKTEMPAGTYDVLESFASPVVLIRSQDAKTHAMVLTNPKIKTKAPDQGSLIFHRYGDTYFLSAIWKGGVPQGHELIPSPAEREVARHARTSFELASVPAHK